MSWVATAIAGSAIIGGVAKGVQGNQDKQRNKGFIDANYRLASDRLNTQQRGVRQDTAESLAARGLSPVAGAMMSGSTPHTLGAQQTADTEHELGLERQDLNNQHDQALKTNQAQYDNTLLGAGVGAVTGTMQAYGAHQDMNAMNPPTTGNSPVGSAMLSGGPTFDRNMDAVIDPVGHPSSPWFSGNQKTLNAGAGTSNADFNVG
jgi:hypothetical protein